MPMEPYEYVCIPIDQIPEEIILQYNLRQLVAADGYI